MRHGETTIVISTTEQANAMLKHLDECKQSARANAYATERKKLAEFEVMAPIGRGGRQRDKALVAISKAMHGES